MLLLFLPVQDQSLSTYHLALDQIGRYIWLNYMVGIKSTHDLISLSNFPLLDSVHDLFNLAFVFHLLLFLHSDFPTFDTSFQHSIIIGPSKSVEYAYTPRAFTNT